ncbi:hypothetical protein PRZ48_008965 [Zasmidium cellare]|uniref:Transposase n=1 Tax=Zasmidium cellare TaxID=395010 RepID=A0ABR0EI00_ZASCE|nr:hypothetical protein PRZ48_008965 [Zasmidium cellare]
MPPGRKKPTKFELVRHRRQAKEAGAHNKTNVRLFKLPAEIRNIIYELVVYRRYTQLLGEQYWAKRRLYLEDRFRRLCLEFPDLLRTSSQIRREATGIFFNINSFILSCSSDVHTYDQLLKSGIPRALKRTPRAFLQNMSNLNVTMNLSFKKCKYWRKGRMGRRHAARIHLIVKGEKYTIHAEYDRCHGGYKCSDGMADAMAEYREILKDLVKDKMSPTKKQEAGGRKGRVLTEVPRKEIPCPDDGHRWTWEMVWDFEDE